MKVANGLNSLAILPVQKRCARNLLHSPTREGGEPGDNRVTLLARVGGDTPAQLFARGLAAHRLFAQLMARDMGRIGRGDSGWP